MKKAGKPIKINGVTVTPRFDWSDDFARHYRASFRDIPQNKRSIESSELAYLRWHNEKFGREIAEKRWSEMRKLAERPNVIEAVELEKDPQHSTLAFVVYRKRSAFHYVSDKNR